jgi:hypothetical protein
MCPIGFLMLGSTPAPTNESSSRAPGLSWSATRLSWLLPNHLPRRRPSPNRNLGWPSTTCASFEHEAPTQADDEPVMGRSGRPRRSRPSQPYGGLPHRRAPGPHFGRTQRTPATHGNRTPDSGRRTADTWTLRCPHRTLDIGPVDRQAWTLVARTGHRTPDTGHWTPDAGRGRGQADEGAAGIRTFWATTPSDRALGRPTVFLWTAPAALGSPCRLGGEAAFQREIASRRQLLGRSAGVERRLGALLSSDDYGSSVERTAKLHPLWQVPSWD